MLSICIVSVGHPTTAASVKGINIYGDNAEIGGLSKKVSSAFRINMNLAQKRTKASCISLLMRRYCFQAKRLPGPDDGAHEGAAADLGLEVVLRLDVSPGGGRREGRVRPERSDKRDWGAMGDLEEIVGGYKGMANHKETLDSIGHRKGEHQGAPSQKKKYNKLLVWCHMYTCPAVNTRRGKHKRRHAQ